MKQLLYALVWIVICALTLLPGPASAQGQQTCFPSTFGPNDQIGDTLPVHATDEVERRLVDAVMAAGARVLQQVPHLAAIDVPRNAYMRTQARMHARDAIPTAAEQGFHFYYRDACSRGFALSLATTIP